ncbi:hypothetical protein DERP_010950 [Dermatophagoides pteronyssinus]|uniref:Uncharacterized protein n=1 Tax=Dermatophagoides pteronyssinus TaxID=6956 RepID=A0ABQ8JV08_DERPT|nr:hypothetical protein DERP_010950 [Dermatophagoides pteronyssinus]
MNTDATPCCHSYLLCSVCNKIIAKLIQNTKNFKCNERFSCTNINEIKKSKPKLTVFGWTWVQKSSSSNQFYEDDDEINGLNRSGNNKYVWIYYKKTKENWKPKNIFKKIINILKSIQLDDYLNKIQTSVPCSCPTTAEEC